MEVTKTDFETKLPLSKKPPISCYPYHAALFHIARSDDLFVEWDAILSDFRMDFSKLNEGEGNRISENCKMRIEEKNGQIAVALENDDQETRSGFYYYGVSGNGSISFRMSFFKACAPSSELGIRLSDEKGGTTCQAAVYGESNLTFSIESETESRVSFLHRVDLNGWLKMELNDGVCSFHYSDDGACWEKFVEFRIGKSAKYRVGYFVKQAYNYFDDWLYSNYIQLYYDKSGKSANQLDYFTGITRKEYSTYCINPFLKIFRHELGIVSKISDLSSICQRALKDRYYIYLNVDGEDTLIYGWTKKTEEFYALSLGLEGEAKQRKLSLGFENQYTVKDDFYVMEKAFPLYGDSRYQLDLNTVIIFLEDYVQGKNTDRLIRFYSMPDKRVYGIRIYEQLIEDIKEGNVDKNHYFLLAEHKCLMKERLRYFEKRCYISEEICTHLCSVFDRVQEKVEDMYHVLKSKSLGKDVADEMIRMIQEVKEVERKELSVLIEELKSRNAVAVCPVEF